jgi:uncharacterized protein YjbJ (UPF0337 family)
MTFLRVDDVTFCPAHLPVLVPRAAPDTPAGRSHVWTRRTGRPAGQDIAHERREVNTVAGKEKSKSKMEQAKGKAKEAAGRAVGNERMTAEGRAEQSKGDARQAKEKGKDVFRH